MKLPTPRDRLADCLWLPRLVAKARLLARGELPAEYVARFCHPGGVDGHFLAHFELTRDDIVTAAANPDAEIARWFSAQPNAAARIAAWNRLAPNLGRPGFPMAERLPVALATTYCHLDASKITTVFEALEADEAGA